MIVTPTIPQSQAYHNFADQRSFLGIKFTLFSHHHHFLLKYPFEFLGFWSYKSIFSGIPNFLNVISNFPFLIIGLIGLILCFYPEDYFSFRCVITYFFFVKSRFKLVKVSVYWNSLRGEKIGWTCFYIGVAAVAFGSSYYHLHPNDATLLWDRLPVRSYSFSSLLWDFVCFVLFLITGFDCFLV